jgi:chitodextrinase
VLAATSNDGANFASRENTTTTRRPQLVVTFSPQADAGPPTAPTLAAQATGPTQASLSWSGATDDIAVSGYEVYRGGALVATLGNVTSYTDTGLAPATTYAYTVRALDAAGNRSPHSNTANVITPAAPATTTLTFSPDADARVQEANAATNYGTSSWLRTDGGSNPDVESYLRFQLSGITGTVTNARLRVCDTDNATVDGPAAYGTSSSWTETGITWSNRPARAGGPYDDKGAIAAGACVEWNVTPLVTANGARAFVLAGTSSDGANFASRQDGTTSRRPQLIVTFGS